MTLLERSFGQNVVTLDAIAAYEPAIAQLLPGVDAALLADRRVGFAAALKQFKSKTASSQTQLYL
jgi:hypothetical protein